MKIIRFLCGIVIALLLWSGCDSSTDSGPSLAIQMPKMGSSYTYQRVDLDSLGRQIPGSELTFTDSVIETGLSYKGKTRVMHLTRLENNYAVGDAYYSFEPNGDISAYIDYGGLLSLPSFWITYPVQSYQAKTYTLLDTTIVSGGTSTRMTAVATLSYAGISSMTIHDSTLMLVKIKIVGTQTITPDPQNMSYSVTADNYFAPSIGYVAQTHQDPYKIPGETFHRGEDIKLVDYLLP